MVCKKGRADVVDYPNTGGPYGFGSITLVEESPIPFEIFKKMRVYLLHNRWFKKAATEYAQGRYRRTYSFAS